MFRTVVMAFHVWLDCETGVEADAGCAVWSQIGTYMKLPAGRSCLICLQVTRLTTCQSL